jgi:hypothetical protein
MNYKKFATIASGISILAASFAPLSASALSNAAMTLSGDSNTNGNFAVTVYEDTGADTVTGANVVLNFSSAVSNVSYDYSVGPFVATTPSGAHNAYGTVTGSQPVAVVRFTVASPATVTASVSSASYLKHVDGTTIANFVINGGSADFTYTAPAATSQPAPAAGSTSSKTGSTPATSTATTPAATSSTSTTTPTQTGDKPAVLGVSNAKATVKQSSHTGAIWTGVAVLVAAAGAIYYWTRLRQPATAAAATSKKSAAKRTPAKNKKK